MSDSYKHKDKYNVLHNIKIPPRKRLINLMKGFDRENFFDWDLKIAYRKYKDYKRGGEARIKPKKFK